MKRTSLKKLVLPACVLAATGSASSQPSVTLFGIVDATLTRGRGSIANRFQLTNSGYNSARLGFRGTEDLGNGVSASFWLEAGVNNDNGTGAATNTNNQASGGASAAAGTQGLTFNRRSTVSLAGGWGELRLGRDYTPQFYNLSVFDPFGVVGVGINQALVGANALSQTAARASNSIGFFLPPNTGGVYGQVQVYLGENASNAGSTSDDGSGGGVRVGYASGPFNVAYATSITRYASGDVHQNNIAGQWSFGFGRLMANYDRDSVGPLKGHGWLIGGLMSAGVGEIRAAFSRYTAHTIVGTEPRTDKLALGYVYNLSKRTALYATVARVRNSEGAKTALGGSATAANQPSTGYDLGVRHTF